VPRVLFAVTHQPQQKALSQQGQPVIVFVRTGELPYWTYSVDHALVVVGFGDAELYVNDPHFVEAPIAVPQDDFELAWLERDYAYALITR
jgi:uncharacterized protein YvpB